MGCGARLDRAGTGDVTPVALRADFERLFAIGDSNHDGAIDGFEVRTYENSTVPEILLGAGRGLQGAAAYGLRNDPEPLRSADFNLDGRVSLPEYRRKADDTFGRLDKDHDGRLTRAELPLPNFPAAASWGGRLDGPGAGHGSGGGRRR